MKYLPAAIMLSLLVGCSSVNSSARRPVRLADGVSFAGREGDPRTTWRVERGAFGGRPPARMVPQNDFPAPARPYTIFILRHRVRLMGTEVFVKGGVKFRSQRTKTPPYEMSGYQADMG